MAILTRRSVLRSSLGLAAAGALARPHIANAAATTAEVWLAQGFVPEEDSAFNAMVADYEKASGNKIDYSIIPFAALRQKEVSAITSGVVPDVMEVADFEFAPIQSWDDKLVDVGDIVETQKADFVPTALSCCYFYNNGTKKRGYYMVPMKITAVPFHIWRSLVEKGGYKISDIPNTWDAFLDFFKPVQDKLRAQGMRNIYAYGYQLTANGNDPIVTFNAFLIAYGGKDLVTPDGRLHTDDPQVRAAAVQGDRAADHPLQGRLCAAELRQLERRRRQQRLSFQADGDGFRRHDLDRDRALRQERTIRRHRDPRPARSATTASSCRAKSRCLVP